MLIDVNDKCSQAQIVRFRHVGKDPLNSPVLPLLLLPSILLAGKASPWALGPVAVAQAQVAKGDGVPSGKSLENLRLDTLSSSTRVEDQRLDVIRLSSQNNPEKCQALCPDIWGHLCHCSDNL